jgi:Domain of unknown function (DUF1876)
MQNQWSIELTFEEDDKRTAATARLTTPGSPELRGHGYARRNPADRPVPQIGEEVAAARALSNLAHELLERAASDIENETHQPAHLNG